MGKKKLLSIKFGGGRGREGEREIREANGGGCGFIWGGGPEGQPGGPNGNTCFV